MTWKRYLKDHKIQGIKFKTVMTEGNPAVEIVKTAADENGCDSNGHWEKHSEIDIY